MQHVMNTYVCSIRSPGSPGVGNAWILQHCPAGLQHRRRAVALPAAAAATAGESSVQTPAWGAAVADMCGLRSCLDGREAPPIAVRQAALLVVAAAGTWALLGIQTVLGRAEDQQRYRA